MRTRGRTRRGVALAACAFLAVGVVACGDDDDGSPAASGGGAAAKCGPDYEMGMLVVAQLKLFDNMVEGFKQGFSEETGVPVGEIELEQQNAQGDPGNFQSLARAFATGSDDLIGVIGTPTTIALAQATKDKPIVTISIDDPVVAGVAKSPEAPGGNVTGSMDAPPVEQIVEGILEIQPDAKKIGTIYTSGNDFLVQFNKDIAAVAEQHGVELVETAISNSNELQSAARAMTGEVDAIVIGRDGSVAAGLPAIAAEAERNKLPVYLAYTGPDALVPGVVGATGSDEREVGRLAGEVAGKICKGADPATTPFAVYSDHRWQFRKDTLAADGLTVPPALAEQANVVDG
jgi:putative ABC transport system substrate-binding protein